MFAAKHIHCNLVHKCDLAGDPIQALKDAFRLTDEQFIPKAKKEVNSIYTVKLAVCVFSPYLREKAVLDALLMLLALISVNIFIV